LPDLAGLFQVNIPTLLLACWVLEGESEDRASLLDGVFALFLVGEGGSDQVEGFGRGPGIFKTDELAVGIM
jgi:hypothetical protein